MKQLKVWGGRYMDIDEGFTRAFVAAYTKKQAIEISGISYSEITNYWSLTGNEFELSIAKEVGVWVYKSKMKYSHLPDSIKKIK